MTLSPIYLKIFFTFSTAWKLWLLSDPQLDHIINTCKCTVRSTYMAHSKFFNILINVFNITGFPCILCILLYACKSSFWEGLYMPYEILIKGVHDTKKWYSYLFLKEAPYWSTGLPYLELTAIWQLIPSCLLRTTLFLFYAQYISEYHSTQLFLSIQDHISTFIRRVDEEINFNSYCPFLQEPLGLRYQGQGQMEATLGRVCFCLLKISLNNLL